jgi:hypothetical protein
MNSVMNQLSGWRFEQWIDTDQLILTLTTSDDFEVSFSADPVRIGKLEDALQELSSSVAALITKLDS